MRPGGGPGTSFPGAYPNAGRRQREGRPDGRGGLFFARPASTGRGSGSSGRSRRDESGPAAVASGTPAWPPVFSRRAAILAAVVSLAAILALSEAVHARIVAALALLEPFFARDPVLGALLYVALAALSAMLVFFSSVILVPAGIHTWGRAGCFSSCGAAGCWAVSSRTPWAAGSGGPSCSDCSPSRPCRATRPPSRRAARFSRQRCSSWRSLRTPRGISSGSSGIVRASIRRARPRGTPVCARGCLSRLRVHPAPVLAAPVGRGARGLRARLGRAASPHPGDAALTSPRAGG